MSTDFLPERRHATLTPGEALRIARELQELSQSELARMTGIAPSAISAFESGAREMGLKRVKVLAEALSVHPAVIAFPDYVASVTPRRFKTEGHSSGAAPRATAKRAVKVRARGA